MKYDRSFFDAGIDRKGTRCVKWDADFIQPGDLPMWVADWDFQCADPIVDALKQRAAHPCYGYPCGDPRDQEAFCGYWQRRHGVSIQPAQTLMLPCVVTGIRQMVLTFTQPGDGVLMMTPLYGPFHDSIKRSGRRLINVPLLRREDARYDIDFAGVEKALQEGVRLILFCNPHNPVSRSWRKEELRQLAELAKHYDALLLSDEIHADFVYKPLEFVSMLAIPEAADRTLMLTAASKTFNIPGLQQAMAVSYNADILKKISDNLEMQGVTSGNVFALPATQAAYTKCDDWLDGMLDYLSESRDILKKELAQQLPLAVLTPIEATALSWIDLRAYAPTCAELTQKIKAHHLVINEGNWFGPEDGEGFMRLNFACPHATLREGVRRLAEALTK